MIFFKTCITMKTILGGDSYNMIKILAIGLLTLMMLNGCEENKQSTYKCSDYKTITDKKIKEELEKRCPAVVGTENIKKSNSDKNGKGNDMLSELSGLPE
ncbi:MAG: entry exclusion lipoprotein TrbK [Gilliamella sp.]|nr:entry exclusion lipoprotein TrbK [Gilliamella sp.]